MIAFQKFKEIDSLSTIQDKHKAWLKDYEGLVYSIAYNSKHTFKWNTEKRRYLDKDFRDSINLIGRLPNRTIIEFDGDPIKAKEYLNQTQIKLKELKIGHIRSSHSGKSDYLWVEFNRAMTDKEIENFLCWIVPEHSEVDLNFKSSNKVFAVLFARHWRHNFFELPLEYFEGNQINYDSLGIKQSNLIKKNIKFKDFNYLIGLKNASKIFTSKGQAERFSELQPIYYDKAGLWWLWNNKEFKWEIVDEIDILNMISLCTGQDIINPKNRTIILNSLKQQGRLNIPEPIKTTWIQFKNKIYDIETGNSFESSPKYFAVNRIPHEVSYDLETPMMDKIFKEWVGDKYVQTLYEILAYSLLPDYPIHRMFCLIGGGSNGKSCFLRLIEKFVGSENLCATELETLLKSRFEITKLHKKLVCCMGETNFSELNQTSVIKKLTGQDSIGFEYKNKNPFEDKNYAKIIIATNNLPSTTDKTEGFYRRWLIIDFNNKFEETKEILNDIPLEEYKSLAGKSLMLLNKLLKERKFSNEGSVEERMKRYEEKSNPFEKFWKENIIEDPNEKISLKQFKERIDEWSKENKFRKMSDSTINQYMKEKGIEKYKRTMEWVDVPFNQEKPRYWVWEGIKWV